MKRNLILLVLVFTANFYLMAQKSWCTMLKDSTIWCYLEKETNANSFKYYNYIVDGDTIINSKIYKKIYEFSDDYNPKTAIYREAMREQDSKIFLAGDWTDPGYNLESIDGETVLYNFSLNEGDHFAESKETGEQSAIGSIIYLDLLDGVHRYYQILGQYKGSWIEGIGSVFVNPFSPCHLFLSNLSNNCLREFVQDGKMIYNSPNFIIAKDNVHWIERKTSKENETFILNKYHIKGDTIINQISFKKIYLNSLYHGAIRMNMEHKIYYVENETITESLLYDFDWPSGKELCSENLAGNDFILISSVNMLEQDQLSMTLLDGKEYDYRILTANPNPDGIPFNTLNKEIRLIKDIGLTSGIFSHVKTGQKESPDYNDLVSVYDGDKLIYLNPAFKENGELATSIETIGTGGKVQVTVDNGQAVFTLKDGISIPNSRLLIYAVDGKLITTRSLESGSASIGNLPEGVYYYRTEGGEGMPDNGKFLIE